MERKTEDIVEQAVSRKLTRRTALGLAGATALSASGLLAACGSDGGTAEGTGASALGNKKAKAGQVWNLQLLTNDWNTVMTDAAERTATLLGIDDYNSAVFEGDETAAFKFAQDAVSAGAAMWFIQAADGSSLPAIARLANSREIYMSNMWAEAPWYSVFDAGPYYVWFLTGAGLDLGDDMNFYETAKYTLQEYVDTRGDTGTVHHIAGIIGGSIDSQRTRAVKRAIAEFPGLKLVGGLEGRWGPEGGNKAAKELVSRYGKPDVLISQNDGILDGALAAYDSLGIVPGEDVLCGSSDGENTIIQQIQAGRVVSTAWTSPAYFGAACVVHCFDALNGVEYTAPERQMGIWGLPITKENVDGFIKRYVDNKNLPFDPKLMSRYLSGDKFDPMAHLQPINMAAFWAGAGVDKPSGYEYPEAYLKAGGSTDPTDTTYKGEMKEIDDLYQANYKIKMDDFAYEGVAV